MEYNSVLFPLSLKLQTSLHVKSSKVSVIWKTLTGGGGGGEYDGANGMNVNICLLTLTKYY